jgi:hypothetical protein
MTASPGREVDANLLRGAALGSAQPAANPQDTRGQNLGDLVETLGGGHEVGMYSVRHQPGETAFQTRRALGLDNRLAEEKTARSIA